MIDINNKLKHLLRDRKLVNAVNKNKLLTLTPNEREQIKNYLYLLNDNIEVPTTQEISRRYALDAIDSDIKIIEV